MPKQVTTKYTKLKDHKGTIRYQAVKSWETSSPDKPFEPNPIRDIYVDRAFSNGVTELELTLRAS